MNPRRKPGGLANPVLIGAITVLAVIVAVFLAYNANNGLPFVPSYDLHVQVPDANELTHGAEVHMGGALVGFVTDVRAVRTPSGDPIAVLDLKLDKSIGRLPVDSTFTIALKGAIGQKYLAIGLGHSKRTYPSGATVPMSQTSATVDLDQVLDMFSPPTRTGVVASTTGFSDGLAGRGISVNDAIGAFVPLLGDLAPVARNLASPHTDLAGFLRGLESFTGALAPVANTQAQLFVALDGTFRALASVSTPSLQEFISDTPPAFDAVIDDNPTTRPFLTDSATLFSELRPGIATLPTSAPVLADAFAAGARNLPGTSALDDRLVSLAQHLQTYGQTPAVQQGLARLTLTASSLRSPLAFLTPVQASCNYVTLFLRNLANVLSESTTSGTSLRFSLVAIDDVLGGESNPSSQPYTTPVTDPTAEHGPLHVDPYPNTDSPGELAECAAGNEPYSGAAAAIGNPAGNVGLKTESTTTATSGTGSKK
ncbi:MAG TPA: MlaD family protein [Solirubrobacteraceae bacterium]|nr:MlaD family protein [Solirubrobacteraceae bacterium]